MFRVAIITSSDSGFRGEREDKSGPIIKEIVEKNDFKVVHQILLPDDQNMISRELKRICDKDIADLILTTGGTGLSQRDCMPEATMKIAEKIVPGISEAMRAYSMQFTKRAMLSRAVAVIRKDTLIINMPGSPKAVKECLEYIISELDHGLEILRGKASDCAR